MCEMAYGSKYDAALSVKDIAAKVRAEIKDAVKCGSLPAGKYSVRIEESSTSASINVRISELAGEVYDRNFLLDAEAHFEKQRKAGGAIFRHVASVRAAVARVEAMLAAYNFEDTGSLQNVNFFAHVEVMADQEVARAKLVAVAPAGAIPIPTLATELHYGWNAEVFARPNGGDSNVIPLIGREKEPEQVRFLREAGLI